MTNASRERCPRRAIRRVRRLLVTSLEAGENPKVVQERLGHTTITTTMDVYSHVTPTMQRSAVDRFAAAVSGTV